MIIFYIVLDIVIAAIVALTIIKCIKEGFIRSVLGLFKIVIAFFIAAVLTSSASVVIRDRLIMGPVAEKISSAVSSVIMGLGVEENVDSIENIIPSTFSDIASTAGIDMESQVYAPIKDAISNGGEDIAQAISSALVQPVAQAVSSILAFIAIFIVALIGLTFAIWLLDKLCKLPLLHAANKILGLVFGVVYAVFDAWIIARGIVFIISIIASYKPEWIGSFNIEQTYLLRFFYNVNPLSYFKIK